MIVKNYNRDGNECFLWDKIEILREDGDIVIRHTHKAKGSWFNTEIDTKNIILKSMTRQGVWSEIQEYLEREDLIDYITVTYDEIDNLFKGYV